MVLTLCSISDWRICDFVSFFSILEDTQTRASAPVLVRRVSAKNMLKSKDMIV